MKQLTKNSIKHQLPFIACAGSLALGIAFGPKSYPVSHTEAEWGQHVQGLQRVRDVIHQSDLPASTAFWCDSVLTAQQNDIYSQVIPAIKADTAQKKKP
jgi:hypothetical protein